MKKKGILNSNENKFEITDLMRIYSFKVQIDSYKSVIVIQMCQNKQNDEYF